MAAITRLAIERGPDADPKRPASPLPAATCLATLEAGAAGDVPIDAVITALNAFPTAELFCMTNSLCEEVAQPFEEEARKPFSDPTEWLCPSQRVSIGRVALPVTLPRCASCLRSVSSEADDWPKHLYWCGICLV